MPPVKFTTTLTGATIFLIVQYLMAIWRLTTSSSGMENKFSALARNDYLGFLILQNLQMVLAYAVLAFGAAILLQPYVALALRKLPRERKCLGVLVSLGLTALAHGYATLRLVDTRPYFLNEAEFGQWYYRAIDFIPEFAKANTLWVIFTLIPLALIGYSVIWHLRRHTLISVVLAGLSAVIFWTAKTSGPAGVKQAQHVGSTKPPMNVLIIGSDSLRGDLLGCAGYRPARGNGKAIGGVSPIIDGLAARSSRFESCYTAIASTMESGVQLLASQYPQSHGLRHMYPNKETVETTAKRIVTLPKLLQARGYDTAAIGDWCAGYYEVVPLGMEHLSVSTFDNFKIYMSQAVVMAHFVVPLYFDNSLGYRLFPQLEAFAQFVTPEVVTQRVEKRLASVAEQKTPFFWHVFYSCNHLPYRSREPYRSYFADPNYRGKNRNGVDFDIDSFIGSTDLESKWKALPPEEIRQIRALYDGCTRQFDDCVGKILESLKANGLADRTIVIVTSDHGDDHYEPGVTLGHGLTFNGGLHANHVPMIVHVPGAAPQVIPETVRLIDVIPTLADLLDQEKSPTWQGLSFAGWIRQTEKPSFRPFYGETGFPFIQFKVRDVERPKLPAMDEMTFIDRSFNYQFVLKPAYLEPLIQAKQRCLRTQHWKLVCTPTAQGTRHFALFHLPSDPHAENDLSASRPEITSALRAALERWIDFKLESSIAEIFPTGEPN